LTPKRRIADVQVEGNHVLTRAAVREAFGLLRATEYYPERLEEGKRAVLLAYQRHGYYQAKVASELRESPQGVDVLLTVEEGAPTRIAGVSATGQPGLPLLQIEDAVGLQIGTILNRER